MERRGKHRTGEARDGIDFAFVDKKIAIECDGEIWHSSKSAKRRDYHKDLILKKKGLNMPTLDELIQPEIFQDELYNQIAHIVCEINATTVIEIGSSSGLGSTQAIVSGIKTAGLEEKAKVFCIEASKIRCAELAKNHRKNSFIIPYNYCSTGLGDYLSEEMIECFYKDIRTNLNNYPLEEVLRWRREEIEYIKANRIPFHGIEAIRNHNDIKSFDLAILDGSAFTGNADCMKLIYLAKWIVLDDVNGIKNYFADNILDGDSSYELICRNLNLRNGYSVFKRK